MAIAMRALDAVVETVQPNGETRQIPIADFHRLPGNTPHVETTLQTGELITAVTLPKPIGGTHIYHKVRDRASYAFAIVSMGVIVQKDGTGRVAVGGIAHKPWRVEAAEAELPSGTKTKRTAAKVAEELVDRGFAAAAIHGDLGQGAREQALRAFRNNKVDVLVATDVAARGIDVDDVTHVINYQCVEDEKIYLHRVGRTGRAGNKGTAVTFVDWDDMPRWGLINKALGLSVPEPVETYSSSAHLFEDLDIPEGTKGRLRATSARWPASTPRSWRTWAKPARRTPAAADGTVPDATVPDATVPARAVPADATPDAPAAGKAAAAAAANRPDVRETAVVVPPSPPLTQPPAPQRVPPPGPPQPQRPTASSRRARAATARAPAAAMVKWWQAASRPEPAHSQAAPRPKSLND